MLTYIQRVPDVCWYADEYGTGERLAEWIDADALAGVRGRFACALQTETGVTLARDSLGLNKLFIAVHSDGRVLAANYIMDLVREGVPIAAVFAVPAGCVVTLDDEGQESQTMRFTRVEPQRLGSWEDVREQVSGLRAIFDREFARLVAFVGDTAYVCLSGGLDSTTVATLARCHFAKVIAYTYTFRDAGGGPVSTDAQLAEKTAEHLSLDDFRRVDADSAMILDSLRTAIRDGQDWRDFNVHTAIVNVMLGDRIRADALADGIQKPAVLTGDLMNELVNDYSAGGEEYHGRRYYALPAVSFHGLRTWLIRGMQTSDREVGVFSARGSTVVQPYSFCWREFVDLPDSVVSQPSAKSRIMREVLMDALPDEYFERKKMRAQVGEETVTSGILPTLVEAGYDQATLAEVFCEIFEIRSVEELRSLMRGGVYRPVPQKFVAREGWLC